MTPKQIDDEKIKEDKKNEKLKKKAILRSKNIEIALKQVSTLYC